MPLLGKKIEETHPPHRQLEPNGKFRIMGSRFKLKRILKTLIPARTILIPDELVDPSLGSYLTGPGNGSWRCRPYGSFLLRGRSKHPTPSQISLWREVEARLPEMVKQAIASVPDPPAGSDPTVKFERDTSELWELRLEQDGSIEFFLSPSIPNDACILAL